MNLQMHKVISYMSESEMGKFHYGGTTRHSLYKEVAGKSR